MKHHPSEWLQIRQVSLTCLYLYTWKHVDNEGYKLGVSGELRCGWGTIPTTITRKEKYWEIIQQLLQCYIPGMRISVNNLSSWISIHSFEHFAKYFWVFQNKYCFDAANMIMWTDEVVMPKHYVVLLNR